MNRLGHFGNPILQLRFLKSMTKVSPSKCDNSPTRSGLAAKQFPGSLAGRPSITALTSPGRAMTKPIGRFFSPGKFQQPPDLCMPMRVIEHPLQPIAIAQQILHSMLGRWNKKILPTENNHTAIGSQRKK